jgi:hypothetical protein
VYDSTGGLMQSFEAGVPGSGARVAAGDVDGDLTADLITADGPGAPSRVVIWRGSGSTAFAPYGTFRGGTYVAAGDVDGDGRAEIVTAADAGGGPHVKVWDYDNGQLTEKVGWFAYDPNFHGGVRVAVADVTGSGLAEVITATGPGGGPHVRVWSLNGTTPVESAGWFAYGADWTNGVNVAAGSIDGARAVVTGAGPGGGPHVRIFDATGVIQHEFFVYAPNFTGGVNVAVTSGGGDVGHVLAAPASWGGPHVKALTSAGATIFEFFAYTRSPVNGVNIAAIPSAGSSNGTNQNGGSNSAMSGT